jgi:hypothetical protein
MGGKADVILLHDPTLKCFKVCKTKEWWGP